MFKNVFQKNNILPLTLLLLFLLVHLVHLWTTLAQTVIIYPYYGAATISLSNRIKMELGKRRNGNREGKDIGPNLGPLTDN